MEVRSKHTDRLLSQQLRARTGPDRLALAAEVVAESGNTFQSEIADLLLAELRELSPDLLNAWTAGLPDNSTAAYIKVQCAQDDSQRLSAWERFFTLNARRDPLDLLAYARALAGQGRYEDAAHQLRLAMSQPVRYAFFPRAEKLIKQVAGKIESNLRRVRVAILGSSTTSLIAPLLQALCLRDRIQVEIYEGLYGAIQQEVLDPDSGMAQFRPDIVLIVKNWRDLHLEPVTPGSEADFVQQLIDDTKALWNRLSSSFNCHVVQHAVDYPAQESFGYLAGTLSGGRTRIIDLINLELRKQAPAWVSILDTPALQRETGIRRWEDAAAWSMFKQHPATEALPDLAEAQMAHIRAVLGLTRKVLVTDLDNTLWKGVMGEDGLNGIGIGPGTPAGEAHQQLQQYMLDLKKRGILLAVCSKNNPEDARLPFEQHPYMALRLDDFAVFRANWDDKAANIRAAAKELSLGLDSFVFLDDNPLEREWVRSQLPQVAVVELGPSVFHYTRDLDRGHLFDVLSLSAEDLSRAEQYQIEAKRENLRSSSGSLDEFLGQLQLEASVEPIAGKNLTRVTQLVNKTNQFNLTTRRYTEAQVKAIVEDPRGWAGAFYMSDRMGSYGLIGVLFCKQAQALEDWEIDTWLMSCRTLGRNMEKFMFDRMMDAAVERGIRRVIGVYRPTQKNALVKDLYVRLGFHRVSESAEEISYEKEVPSEQVNTATHVRDVSMQTQTMSS